jgi:hypothetical protein
MSRVISRRFASGKPRALGAAAAVASSLGLLAAAIASSPPARAATSNFELFNANSGRCIGISNGLAGDWTCTGHADQTWNFGPPNANAYSMIINGNQQCLAVKGGTIANGTRILGYSPCTGTPDQFWKVVQDPSNPHGAVSLILNEANSSYVIGVSGSSTANGAAVVLWSKNGHFDQDWELGPF